MLHTGMKGKGFSDRVTDIQILGRNWMKNFFDDNGFFGKRENEDNETSEREKIRKLFNFKTGFIKYLVLLVAVVLIAKSGFYIIPAGSRGVVFRLGRVSAVTDQGVNFKIPLVDRVIVVNTENIQRLEYGYRTISPGPPAKYRDRLDESKMLTGDNKIVEIDWVLQYQIADPSAFVVNVPSDQRLRQKMIRDIAESTMRQVIASRKLDDVLTKEKEASQTEAKQLIQQNMEALKTGIFVVAVQFQDVVPPEPVQAAFSEINSAKAEKNRLILEADKYSNQILSRAEGKVDQILNAAEAYKFRRIAIAEGEAARISSLNASYKENPELVLNNLWFENMQDIWPELKVIIVDERQNSLQVLPLEKLMEMNSPTNGETR